MQQQLINLSPDLKQLRDEGYEIQVRGGYLLIHHIPYVNHRKEIKFGVLVSELTLANNTTTARPSTHVIGFMGEHPCNKDGSIISGIQNATVNEKLYEGITINHRFSNKPAAGYENYYQKVKRYADVISAPAKSLDKTVTEKTFKVIPEENEDGVFVYYDTNASRANIQQINDKFKGQRVAIVGLGGTGSYILDQVAKTPVREVHLFDGDDFHQHNAFRSPGAVALEQLTGKIKKVDFYKEMYSRMHKGIVSHSQYIHEENLHMLLAFSFIFICIDKNATRRTVIDYLVKKGIPFADVGLGVNVAENNLVGTVRVTSGSAAKNDHIPLRISGEDNPDNEYNTNIQIADLNALNACLAVIKWKKFTGFYQDAKEEFHTTYSINVSQLRNEDLTS